MSNSKPPTILDRARASLNGSNGHHERPSEQSFVAFADPIPASLLKIGDQTGNWFWHGYFARHTTTLLSSLWKAGKTTLIAHLLKALETGGLFCGRMVRPTRVLYATEEPESVWARRRDKIGFGDHVHFQIRPFRTKANLVDWVALMHHLREHVEKSDFGLVFIDPLTTLWPVTKENEAGIVAEALVPLNILTDRAGVVLVHHFRKSGGEEATGSRGSGALPGYVDTIIELRRYAAGERKDRRRVLSGWGRFEETPEELVIELTDGGYVAHGDKGQVRQRALEEVLAAILPSDSPGWGYESIRDALNRDEEIGGSPGRRQILEALASGVERGYWQQGGEGKKGDPHQWWRPPGSPAVSVPVPGVYRARTGTETRGDDEIPY